MEKWQINKWTFNRPDIERVVIAKETPKFVWIQISGSSGKHNLRQIAKNNDFFDTFDAAKAEFVKRKRDDYEYIANRLQGAKNALDKAEALQEPT